jgi:cell division protein FtsA
MARIFANNIVTSIDVGTTKISVLIAHRLDKDRVEILGVGKALSNGLRKGIVVDAADTIHSIKIALQEAELMAGIKIESAYIGISGGHITSINSHGMIQLKHAQVREQDIKQVIDIAKAIPLPEGQYILHVLPQYFLIDDQEPVYDPLHLYGVRLQSYVHIVMGNVACVQNLIMCCESAGITVKDIVLEQLASAHAVLNSDEKELGVAIIDIGGGTADVALYQHNNIRYTMVLPIAGQHFTQDLAIGLRIPLKEAERIKKEYGSALIINNDLSQHIVTQSIDDNQTQMIAPNDIQRILHARANELLTIIANQIKQKKVHHFINAGVVLTGGGSLLAGMPELAQSIFHLPVRVGAPRIQYDLPQSLANPMYATGYGLLLYAIKKETNTAVMFFNGKMSQKIFVRMKSWLSDFF